MGDPGDLFASEGSSREGYTEIFAAQLATPSRVNLLVGKTLRKFFTLLFLSVLAARPGDLLATHPSRKKCMFDKNRVSFYTFSVFPKTLYDYSLSLSTESHPNNPCHSLQTPLLHLFTSKSSRKKVWALILSPHISYFKLHFREYLCWCFDFFVMGLF